MGPEIEDIDALLGRGQARTQDRVEAKIVEALAASGSDGLTATVISHVLLQRNMPGGVVTAALRSLWEEKRIVGRVERRSRIGRPSVVWRLTECDRDCEDGSITPRAASLVESDLPARETPRGFNSDQKRDIWFQSSGRCCICRAPLGADWHADHRKPWSAGGETTVENGQALCAKCNLRKSSLHVEEE